MPSKITVLPQASGTAMIYRPIDENGFTDVVARFLRSEFCHKGIFANRESRSAASRERRSAAYGHPRQRGPPPARDVRHDRRSHRTEGCWNDELFTARLTPKTSGAYHGAIPRQTPASCRIAIASRSGRSDGITSPAICVVIVAASRKSLNEC
jgi:hypothetical protein